ncbi:MAG TPA: glycosyltransferase family 39 protein [Vicinamibacteria bacterium]|nr:glycosyltransferase family 39 protein [Vicinamibacteria bacterium]
MTPTLLTRAMLALMALLLVSSSLHKRFSYDEVDNLGYGTRFLTQGPGAPMNGQRMPVLALNALPSVAAGWSVGLLHRSEWRRMVVRAPTMVFALLLAWLVGRWARELYGPAAGILALGCCAFNPNVLAHGKQVTSDVATAFFTVAAVYGLWRLCRQPGTKTFALGVLATTGALASKFTSVLLFPILLVLALIDHTARPRSARAPFRRVALVAAGFVASVILLLNAVYLFDGSFRPAREYGWKSRALAPLRSVPVPVPLPKVFALGIDYSYFLQENPREGRGNNYVLGELNRDGRWYAFPLMLLLKTPLALFGLLALAARARLPADDPRRGATVFLLLPFAAILAFFSLFVDAQLGIRYVLPALPFLFVFAGRAAVPRPGRWLRAALLTLAAWHLAATLSYHPHYVSYFNELIGRRIDAWRYLADSNLDWEDRSWFIRRFQARHPEMPLVLEPERPVAGYVVVGANQLVGVFGPARYRWLRENFEPIAHIGYSHLVFRVTPARLGEVMDAGAATPPPAPPP